MDANPEKLCSTAKLSSLPKRHQIAAPMVINANALRGPKPHSIDALRFETACAKRGLEIRKMKAEARGLKSAWNLTGANGDSEAGILNR